MSKRRKPRKTSTRKKQRNKRSAPRAPLPERAARWPVRSAWINPAWRTEKLAAVHIVREAPHGALAVGAFLVDLGCLGVKDAYVREVSPSDLVQLRHERVPCAPELGARIITEAQRYAESLGFVPSKDWIRARPLLRGIDASACTEEVPLGRDGKPMYIAGPNDHAPAVLAHLERRLGPDGFHMLVPGGAISYDHSGELPEFVERTEDLFAFVDARADRVAEADPHAEVFETLGFDAELVRELWLDWAVHCDRSDTGPSWLHAYADARGLAGDERAEVEGWSDWRRGAYEVVGSGRWRGLLDELEYRVVAQAGTPPAPGSFLLTSLVPVQDGWLQVGPLIVLPSREAARAAAGRLGSVTVEALRRNPEAERLQAEFAQTVLERARSADSDPESQADDIEAAARSFHAHLKRLGTRLLG